MSFLLFRSLLVILSSRQSNEQLTLSSQFSSYDPGDCARVTLEVLLSLYPLRLAIINDPAGLTHQQECEDGYPVPNCGRQLITLVSPVFSAVFGTPDLRFPLRLYT